MYFREYVFNSKNDFMRVEQGLYEFEKHENKLDRIRITKDHKVLGI